jgi:hypothetical protein
MEKNILKHDSALSVNLAETWASHAFFEEALAKFKAVINNKMQQDVEIP